MPIPFIPIAIAAGTAILGVGKSIKAGVDQKDANETNQLAQSIVDDAKKETDKSRKNSSKAVEDLGRQKLSVLDGSIERFVDLFGQLHNVELGESCGLDELKKFRIDKQAISDLRQMSAMASSVVGGAAGGVAAGALTALGAYGGVMTLGAASTGTAIATLSGAAATNATLAFLGGGSLAAGGLGMAGGAAVLGGLVAGPALAVMGFVVGAKASANKDAAYSNYAKAKEFEEEAKTVQTLCKAIRMRANMFSRLLIKLDAIFCPLLDSLADTIQNSGTDYSKFNADEKSIVAANLSIAQALKAVLDTPILTEDGKLTEESEMVGKSVQKVIDAHA